MGRTVKQPQDVGIDTSCMTPGLRYYYTSGTCRQLFARDKRINAAKGFTVWGYPKGSINRRVLNSRISFMKKKIENQHWKGRRGYFARSHYLQLLRMRDALK